MVESIKENFIMVQCMDVEFILGQMDENIKDSILETKSMYIYIIHNI